jgi:tetratricopeptide (TPR) repeat protein
VSNICRLRMLCFYCVIAGLRIATAQTQEQKLNAQYQSAVAQYDAGHFDAAAAQLEALLPQSQNSFAVHELLGLVYASLAKTDKAIEQLQLAVQLKPEFAEARTNLAVSLNRAGKVELAGEQFRKALTLEPQNYDANHNLGEFYIRSGKLAEATPCLEAAQRIDPSVYDNGYDLAQADFLLGRYDKARLLIAQLVKARNTGELHNLLAQVEEKDGKFVAAENEFEAAAHLDPSEDNLFDWASELLLHRTYEPAIEIFKGASSRYPKSARLMIGLGMAQDLAGKYEDAVKALLAAADLDPLDARCYLFLSKAYDNSPAQAEDVIQRFRRYAELQPDNAAAQYYYAMSLWKGKRLEDASVDFQAVEALLRKAISLDDKLVEAHVEMGNLYADQHAYARSIPEYQRALELDANLPDAHYRLGQDYVHTGDKQRAQVEFEVYQKQRAQHLADVDKERAEVQQFVYAAKDGSTAKQ